MTTCIGFPQDALLMIGFPKIWIRGMSTLYISTQSNPTRGSLFPRPQDKSAIFFRPCFFSLPRLWAASLLHKKSAYKVMCICERVWFCGMLSLKVPQQCTYMATRPILFANSVIEAILWCISSQDSSTQIVWFWNQWGETLPCGLAILQLWWVWTIL